MILLTSLYHFPIGLGASVMMDINVVFHSLVSIDFVTNIKGYYKCLVLVLAHRHTFVQKAPHTHVPLNISLCPLPT